MIVELGCVMLSLRLANISDILKQQGTAFTTKLYQERIGSCPWAGLVQPNCGKLSALITLRWSGWDFTLFPSHSLSRCQPLCFTLICSGLLHHSHKKTCSWNSSIPPSAVCRLSPAYASQPGLVSSVPWLVYNPSFH